MDVAAVVLDITKLIIGVAVGSIMATKIMMWLAKREIRKLVQAPEVREAVAKIVDTAIDRARQRVNELVKTLPPLTASAGAAVRIEIPSLQKQIEAARPRNQH